MREREKMEEIERLLKELQASKDETAVTVEEVEGRSFKLGRSGMWNKSFLFFASMMLLIAILLPIGIFYVIKNASTFKEEKLVVLERIQNLNELATAEAYTKVIIERQDNTVFGKSIGVNLPGTKRQLLVVIPGSVKAGVQLGGVEAKDIVFNEENKTATLTLPQAEFLGGAELYFDDVDIFSYEGVFRVKANIEEAYELAEEAKKLLLEEANEQGVLEMAEMNAEKTLSEMFAFIGYDVTIQFKE